MKPAVAIVGRPNVGKSTLFNRLTGKRHALVDDTPGVTRDRREGEGRLGHLEFRLIDTAGFEEAAGDTLPARMRAQTERAIEDADVCLFLIDARAGVTALDENFAELLRRSGRPVVLIANKCEGRAADPGLMEAYALGLGEPVALSAEHGEGLGDLAAALEAALPPPGEAAAEEAEDAEAAEGEVRIAIVGRPNVGKSTLINTLLGEERLLTGPEAGITRDSISVSWAWRGRSVKLFDTAGMRRRARVTGKLEKLSVSDTVRAIRFAEVVIILMDADMAFEKQDLQIADLVIREGRAPVIGLNKWDMIEDRQAKLAELREKAERLLPQVRGAHVVPVSGEQGTGLQTLLEAAFKAYDVWNRRVPTSALNDWLTEAVERHPPPAVRGRRIRIRYITQVKARPPSFAAFCSRPKDLPDAYTRYLVNGIRDAFDMPGTPIRLFLRKQKNPYA
ncbi:MAG: ribosome biogenesis GTPase Der [Alphaproteobacteria bacterium]